MIPRLGSVNGTANTDEATHPTFGMKGPTTQFLQLEEADERPFHQKWTKGNVL